MVVCRDAGAIQFAFVFWCKSDTKLAHKWLLAMGTKTHVIDEVAHEVTVPRLGNRSKLGWSKVAADSQNKRFLIVGTGYWL
jgi:hypothetical protein